MTNVYLIKLNKELDKIKTSKLAWDYLRKIYQEDYCTDIDKIGIVRNIYNKPYLKNPISYFNISHSSKMIAICISPFDCGVDIEKIKYEDRHFLLTKLLGENEVKKYNAIEDSMKKIEYLFKVWTTKESYFKCKGTGILYTKLKEDLDINNTITFIIDNIDKYYLSISLNKDINYEEPIQIKNINTNI